MVSPDHVQFWAKFFHFYLLLILYLRMLCAYITNAYTPENLIKPQNIAIVHLPVSPCTLHKFDPERPLQLLFCYKIQ